MPVDIPYSSCTVTVKIIDTGCRIHLPPTLFVAPQIHGHDDLACPAYSFSIENERLGRKVIFDLGVKKEWEKLPKPSLDGLAKAGLKIDRGKDVCEILKDDGVEMRGIESIIWRRVALSQKNPDCEVSSDSSNLQDIAITIWIIQGRHPAFIPRLF